MSFLSPLCGNKCTAEKVLIFSGPLRLFFLTTLTEYRVRSIPILVAECAHQHVPNGKANSSQALINPNVMKESDYLHIHTEKRLAKQIDRDI